MNGNCIETPNRPHITTLKSQITIAVTSNFANSLITQIYQTFFKKPNKEVRVRYQIRKRNDKVIYAGYLNCRRIGIDVKNDGEGIQQMSNISFKYEPHQDLLVNSDKFLVVSANPSHESTWIS